MNRWWVDGLYSDRCNWIMGGWVVGGGMGRCVDEWVDGWINDEWVGG